MKQTILCAAVVAIVSSLFSSCRKEYQEVNYEGRVKITLKASSDLTKVEFGDKVGSSYPVTWNETGEVVKMIECANGTYATYNSASYSVSGDHKSASFSFVADPVDASSYDYYFLSPATSFNYTYPSFCSVGAFLNQNQVCEEDSIDPAAAILFSSVTSKALQGGNLSSSFSHISAYGKMTLTNLSVGDGEQIERVTIKAEGKVLTGLNAYVWDSNTYSPVEGYSYDNVSVSMENVETSGSSFDVWFSCWPFSLEIGDKLTVTVSTDKSKYGRTITMPYKGVFNAGGVAEIPVDMSSAVKSSAISELYMLGDACATGWDLCSMQSFTNIDGMFYWEGSLTAAGEFRFPIQKIPNTWWPCLVIDVANNCVVYDSNSAKYYSMGSQYHVPADGLYQVVVDTRDFYNMKYRVTPISYSVSSLCIVGDATPSPWELGSYPMTRTSPNVFSWTGDLIAGTFRLNLVTGDWFPSLMLQDGKVVCVANGAYNASIHQHFTVSAPGTYTITADLTDRDNVQVSIQLQSGSPGNIYDSLPLQTLTAPVDFCCDKATYVPGEPVEFSSSLSTYGLVARYWHLGELLEDEALDASSWTWYPPIDDYQGYLVELVGKNLEGEIVTVATCGVDVSSSWVQFPRYGYLSRFCNCNRAQREAILGNLNRHHINAIQYYEWGYDHHHPLCGTPGSPADEWDKYLTGSTCQREVIQGYIDQGHDKNMVSMFYDLVNGVFEWCENDGCGSTWYLYTDPLHQNKDKHDLDVPPFRSDLYLVDPNLQAWNDYFAEQISDVYKVYDFDGFHIDQLGDRGTVYDYYGNPVDLKTGYKKVIETMSAAEPSKYISFNAVDGYGQEKIAAAPVDILYNELWQTKMADIKTALDNNRSIDSSKKTVLAAYLHGTNSGYFNTPAVLMADAAIFSMGGAHIELGENLISDIYWPACCLQETPELEAALVNYYDFLTAYENLLRDDVSEFSISPSSSDVQVCSWNAASGKVNIYATQNSSARILHLHNYVDAAHMDWRDEERTQVEPQEIKNFTITLPISKNVSNVWAASPDYYGGAPKTLDYSIKGGGTSISIEVPELKYWTMIVME